jgi:hypothetical protein
LEQHRFELRRGLARARRVSRGADCWRYPASGALADLVPPKKPRQSSDRDAPGGLAIKVWVAFGLHGITAEKRPGESGLHITPAAECGNPMRHEHPAIRGGILY